MCFHKDRCVKEQSDGIIQQHCLLIWRLCYFRYSHGSEARPGNCSLGRIPWNSDQLIPLWKVGMIFPSETMTSFTYSVSVCHSMTHENVKRSCFSRIKMNERNLLSQHQVKGDVIGLSEKTVLNTKCEFWLSNTSTRGNTKIFFVNCERKKKQNPHRIEKVLFTNCFFWELSLDLLDMTLILWNSGFHKKGKLSRKPQGIL